MQTRTTAPRWMVLSAFGVIYFVWGSTFLAIRIGVRELPPLLFAAIRFLIAGGAMYIWLRLRGTAAPLRREWLSATFLALLIFVFDYGLLFWAEQRVPSGIAAVVMATIPVFIALAEIVFLRSQKLTITLAIALLIGIAGVVILMSDSLHLEGEPINRTGALALLFASLSWSVATVLTRKLRLPPSKGMSAGSQMLAGGVLLSIASVSFGELKSFHLTNVSMAAWLSLLYLIAAGSILGFTAYVWLLHCESPTKVGTYAYVNPVVAVIIGYLFAGEPLGLRTGLGTVCVLASVFLITTARTAAPAHVLVPLKETET